MKVYTKRGDKGETSLIGGMKVSKDDIRIHSYGTVDELNSWVGLLRAYEEVPQKQIDQLIEIQDRLFTMGSLLAISPEGTKMKLPLLYEKDIEYLEEAIDEMSHGLPEIRRFTLPGGSKLIAYCHVTRTVCRRAERLTVGLGGEGKQNELIRKYLNRLSDYFYMLYRKLAHDLQIEEVEWVPRMEE